MKKAVIILLGIFSVCRLAAQVDIKSFQRLSCEEIAALISKPTIDKHEDYPDCEFLNYSDTRIVVCNYSNGKHSLDDFETLSSDFCVFSDYIEGGIKPGDPLSKLQSIDFVHSKYGRNNPKNGLTRIPEGEGSSCVGQLTNYVVFLKEYQRVEFVVENNTIKGFMFFCLEDAPSLNYDFTIRIW